MTLKKENRERGIKGLRRPQIGAIYATLGHWEVSNETATLVMPTGTGKTETMLSLLLMGNIEKLLVIVPTDALRKQVSDKFIDFGILHKVLELLNENTLYPKVGVLKSKLSTSEEIEEFFNRSNVIISTAQIVTGMLLDLQQCIANKCSHLFIDEAHHVGATTWKSFKKEFSSKKILQFTATPFRNDNKSLDGKIIFKNTSMEDILHMLGKRYNVDFVVKSNRIKEYSFTGTFSTQRLERILEYFKISSKINWRYLDSDEISDKKQRIEIY